MLWERIEKLPDRESVALPEPYPQLSLVRISTDGSRWLIGPYKHLKRLAKELRRSAPLREFLRSKQVRLGLRKTDVPPANVSMQKNYGATVPGAGADKSYAAARTNPVAQPFRAEAPINRLGDREENVRSFWETQTPQSHHIVEFNNLRDLGVSRKDGDRELDYAQLPAVLLAAEFHQRYISAILKRAHGMSAAALRAEIVDMYRELYEQRSRLFLPLWEISKVVLSESGFNVSAQPSL